MSAWLALCLPPPCRYYSISSSPLQRPGTCSITVGKVMYTSQTGADECWPDMRAFCFEQLHIMTIISARPDAQSNDSQVLHGL